MNALLLLLPPLNPVTAPCWNLAGSRLNHRAGLTAAASFHSAARVLLPAESPASESKTTFAPAWLYVALSVPPTIADGESG